MVDAIVRRRKIKKEGTNAAAEPRKTLKGLLLLLVANATLVCCLT